MEEWKANKIAVSCVVWLNPFAIPDLETVITLIRPSIIYFSFKKKRIQNLTKLWEVDMYSSRRRAGGPYPKDVDPGDPGSAQVLLCVCVLSHVWLCIYWAVTYQAPLFPQVHLSMFTDGFASFPAQGIFTVMVKSCVLTSPALAGEFLTINTTRKAQLCSSKLQT